MCKITQRANKNSRSRSRKIVNHLSETEKIVSTIQLYSCNKNNSSKIFTKIIKKLESEKTEKQYQ